ncbi:P-loop containing nucleoside triphosphate hydrolase protein [Wallemia mellicola]|nr:P-loop containing nucleoside triphosphate hydrolase protein [Wallemia mellicola]
MSVLRDNNDGGDSNAVLNPSNDTSPMKLSNNQDNENADIVPTFNLLEDDDEEMSEDPPVPKLTAPLSRSSQADDMAIEKQTTMTTTTPLEPSQERKHPSIRLAPVQATSTTGQPLTFGRRKKLDGFSGSKGVNRSSSCLETPVHKLITELNSLPSTSSVPTQKVASSDTRLWTDKYRPHKFTDLMGDDRLNRQVMSWLKEWDQCVFGKKTADSLYKRKRDAEPFAYRDPYNLGRPQERVMLISGPPGLGKTTLAYVIAKQAGYRVFEVNASDDRSARTVDEKLKSALDVNPITFDGKIDKRPTLVLIDEIDGATGEGSGGFVRQLINITNDHVPKKRKNGTTQPRLLLRPIICICNDLYAPSLRSLRPISRIVRYKPPSMLSTVTRLKDICGEEEMYADTKSLNALAEASGGDIRNCLNTLQFMKNNSMDIHQAITNNSKDTSRSVPSVMQQVFKLQKSKTASVQPTVQSIIECGEYDKISQSCFEGYLTARVNDSRWERYINAINALTDADIRTGINDDYTPYHLSKFHLQFANINNGHISAAGSKDYEVYLERTNNLEVAKSFKTSLPNELYRCYDLNNLVVELSPLLTQILSVNIKLTNAQVATEADRKTMQRAVDICVDLNLDLKLDKDEDNKPLIRMEPAIDSLTQLFTSSSLSTFSTKQLLSKEINNEKTRRKTAKVKSDKPSLNEKYAVDNFNPVVTVDDATPKDFFGRKVKLTTENSSETPLETAKEPTVAPHYKYFEGFSNAVRKPIKISQLL